MRLGVTTMRVRLLILLALFPCPSWAVTTYYACASTKNIDAASQWGTTTTGSATCGGTIQTWPFLGNGDTLNANGATSLAVNVDPGSAGTVQVTLTTDVTNGGGFTCATASGPATIHANITATHTTGMATTGSSGSGCNISGNTQGGAAGNTYGVLDSHSVSTITLTGNTTGGSGTNAHGYFANTSATVNLVGNAIAGTAAANGFNTASTSATVTGNCVGNDTASALAAGCATVGSNIISVTGALIGGLKAGASNGNIRFSASGTNYAVFAANSSYVTANCLTAAQVAAGTCTNALIRPAHPGVALVLSGTNYGPFTGTYTPSGGGGGVSVFGSW